MKKLNFAKVFTLIACFLMLFSAIQVNASSVEKCSSPETKEINAVTPPVATAATEISSTYFKANWNAVPNATAYYIRVVDKSTQEFVIKDQETTKNFFVVSNLNPKNGYHYSVKVKVGDETSDISNWIDVTTLPAAPVAKDASDITSASFTAHWDDIEGVNNYLLRVVDKATQDFFLKDFSLQENSYNVTGLQADHSYSYALYAVYSTDGQSGISNWIDVKTAVAVGIENEHCPNFKIYPNPASDYLIIDGILAGSKIEVISVNGQIVKSMVANRENETLQLSGIEKGLYMLIVKNENGQIEEKFMIK
ncbi:MAG TPA: T9SS type A sorting domain-containing protein [Prolixibacteraceae bacterium]|nr:T9SS type A sorting domain-containing protein [Prolixibacteraceae bacterium]HUM89091.1 T9SS type A sorting domain-containing protein [Prolixibacteraceae bacterium]